jgi:hypothetical protein
MLVITPAYCNTPGIDLPDDATPLTKQRKVWGKKTLKSDNISFVHGDIHDRQSIKVPHVAILDGSQTQAIVPKPTTIQQKKERPKA